MQIAGFFIGALVVWVGGFLGARIFYRRNRKVWVGIIVGGLVAFALLCLACLSIWLLVVR